MLCAGSAIADVRVSSDSRELVLANADYEARFAKGSAKTGAPYGWTLSSLKYRGHDLISETGANGAALRRREDKDLPDGGYIGSRHGGENVSRVMAVIDGKEHSLETSMEISGDHVVFVKESIIGPYEHVSRITLDDSGLREEAFFKVLEDASSVDVFYPFMHCLSKSLTNWITGSAEGMLASGEFTNDDSFSNLGRLKWVGAYSPDDGYGVVASYAEDYGRNGDWVHRFWNRRSDNKLYFWPRTLTEGEAKFVVRISGFEAPAESWTQTVEEIEAQLSSHVDG